MSAKSDDRMTTGVCNARGWANELVRRESRGPGDVENAMRRLETRYGIPWRFFWRLRYRPPDDVLVGVYIKLKVAYEAELERQQRLLRHELAITMAKAGPLAPAVVAAAAVVDEDEVKP